MNFPRYVLECEEYVLFSVSDRVVGFTAKDAKELPYPEFFPQANFLLPWAPPVAFPLETAIAHPAITGWFASADLIQAILPELPALKECTFLRIAEILEGKNISFLWTTADLTPSFPSQPITQVLAIVPHFKCEPWLHRCLASLTQQTRPLDNIVVIDDHSPQPPIEIVQQFPNVTLLAADQTVGPYRLVQQIIEETNYDAYLFQDADDWSSCDRLALLLQAMITAGAELVGTQELRVLDNGELLPVTYPLDVNAALAEKPGHPLLHPTSLVTRRLVLEVGGFATGLKFGGDTEFLLRSIWLAKSVNIPQYCYFRRKRPDSLTTHPETGLDSPARQALLKQLKQRAIANLAAHRDKTPLCLSPLAQASPVRLNHVIGPKLKPAHLHEHA